MFSPSRAPGSRNSKSDLREARGRPCLADPADEGMIVFGDDAVGGDLRVTDHVAAVENGSTGDILGLEALQPFGAGGRSENLLGQFEPGVDVTLAPRRRAKALVVEPLGPPEGARERFPFLVLLDRHRNVAVARLVDEIDEALGMLLADTVIDHGLGFHVRSPQEGDDRIEHGDVDRLALSGSFPVEERRRDRLGGDDSGELVGDDGPHQARPRLV